VSDGSARVLCNVDSVHTQSGCSVNVCFKIIKKCSSRRSRTQSFHGQFINARVWFAHADFVAVDDGVKDGGEVHEWPPPFAKLEHIICEDADRNLRSLQIVDECHHVVIQLKIER